MVPGDFSPMLRRSTSRTGVISAAVPVMNTSSATYKASRPKCISDTGMFSRSRISMAVRRVMPARNIDNRWCFDLSFTNYKEVFSRTFCNISAVVEHDGFIVSVVVCFVSSQDGVYIVANDLCSLEVGINVVPWYMSLYRLEYRWQDHLHPSMVPIPTKQPLHVPDYFAFPVPWHHVQDR